MSKANNWPDLFPNPDPSGDFGRDEGIAGHRVIASLNPDLTLETIAKRAVRLKMATENRFDVDPRRAAEAVIEELRVDLPEFGDSAQAGSW